MSTNTKPKKPRQNHKTDSTDELIQKILEHRRRSNQRLAKYLRAGMFGTEGSRLNMRQVRTDFSCWNPVTKTLQRYAKLGIRTRGWTPLELHRILIAACEEARLQKLEYQARYNKGRIDHREESA